MKIGKTPGNRSAKQAHEKGMDLGPVDPATGGEVHPEMRAGFAKMTDCSPLGTILKAVAVRSLSPLSMQTA